MQEKIWALMTHVSGNEFDANGKRTGRRFVVLEDEMIEYILEEAPKAGFNAFVLEVNDGIEYGSHPEIWIKNAWSRKKLKTIIKRFNEKGITVYPQLNFSAAHDMWLGVYERMKSTPQYYKLIDDLVKEVYELFNHPKYIHLSMDEEIPSLVSNKEFVCYRQNELYWHDLRFMFDSVLATGATPWIWADPLFDFTEDFGKYIYADELVLSPWYYNSFRKEFWTPVDSRPEYVTHYNGHQYKGLNIKFVEEDPFFVNVRNKAIPLLKKEGYKYIPCASVHNRCEHNARELLTYFKENAPDENILGYVTAPFCHGKMVNKQFFEESFETIKKARKEIYNY